MSSNRMKVMRSVFFTLAFVLCTLTTVHAETPRPNVLFISIDDLNDWLGCYGGHPQVANTPHRFSSAKQGVLFSNAHCQAPICNPSRVSMFLGKVAIVQRACIFSDPNFRTVDPTRRRPHAYLRLSGRHGYYVSTRGKIFHGKVDQASFDHVEKAKGLETRP